MGRDLTAGSFLSTGWHCFWTIRATHSWQSHCLERFLKFIHIPPTGLGKKEFWSNVKGSLVLLSNPMEYRDTILLMHTFISSRANLSAGTENRWWVSSTIETADWLSVYKTAFIFNYLNYSFLIQLNYLRATSTISWIYCRIRSTN